MLRTQDVFRRAGQLELSLLREIQDADPEGRRHNIRLLSHFDHRAHLCLVFEPMDVDMRVAVRALGKNVGINIRAVRLYARQIFSALQLLRELNIVHADLKLDNILLTQNRAVLKVADFGSAFKEDSPDNIPTPYITSRWYRAPEVILGMTYGTPIDVWAAGTILYECFMGAVCFEGGTNNGMLHLFQRLKGRFPNRLIKRHCVVCVRACLVAAARARAPARTRTRALWRERSRAPASCFPLHLPRTAP